MCHPRYWAGLDLDMMRKMTIDGGYHFISEFLTNIKALEKYLFFVYTYVDCYRKEKRVIPEHNKERELSWEIMN